jgi:hypothetical protein
MPNDVLEGFWRLIKVFNGFSLSQLIVSVLFVIGGFAVVNAMYKLSELAKAIREGRVVIE